LAQHNAQFLVEFMAKLGAELAGENEDYNHKGIHNEKKSSGNAGPGVISCWRSKCG
ncbi:hypothetical protein U4W26_17230, partial [Escherichia coli]|nr:hypothetical protein [Escherichia coli]